MFYAIDQATFGSLEEIAVFAKFMYTNVFYIIVFIIAFNILKEKKSKKLETKKL